MTRAWPLTVRGTGALALAILCFVFAGQLGVDELVYFGMLLLALIGVSLVSLYLTRRADTLTRTLSGEVAHVGHTSTITARVGVRTALPTPPGRWTDTLPRALRGEPHGIFPALGSGLRGDERTVELTYPVTGVHRGIVPIGPLRIAVSDPFGLARRRHVLGRRTTVTVVPTLVDLPAMNNYAGAVGGVLHTTTSQVGQGADDLIARPYTPGDSMRRIHWRATAHVDELMVRQEEQESTPEATVVLDRGVLRYAAESANAPGLDPGFETAVSMCVSVAARLCREGYTVEVIDSDGTPLVDPLDGGDANEVDAMLLTFASVVTRRDDALPGLPLLFAGASTGPVVVITGRFDEADATALAPLVYHSSMPLLFPVAPVGEALEAALATGWHGAAIPADGDLITAWSTVTDRGVSRVLD